MYKRLVVAFLAVATAVAAAALIRPSAAGAHWPTITANIACNVETGALTVNYTSTAWPGSGSNPTNDPSRANPLINITLDGAVVTSGAYAAPSYSFSGSFTVTGKDAGDVIEVAAVAVGTWGDGEPGGSVVGWIDLTVPECGTVDQGRFTGGGNQVTVGGAKVTRGLTIHCDKLLSNNLEVNWPGHKFHMLEHVTTVECSDDPNIIQAPPPAPLDTLIGVGTGKYDNADGFTIEFKLQDYGEPGTSDKMAIKIYETANPANVVLNVPLQVLSGGNLQAHFDQPHK
jgi:hypothetical protein